jgi:glyoxylase-like metal-dependent hydrolase (beta-lactamase superfamily II)
MNITQVPAITRRRFLSSTSLLAMAALIFPRDLFAQDEGIVPTMLKEAATSPVEVRPLRRNISVLEGSGGNIAVLTGKDGKLLVDAGFKVSKARILDALASIDAASIKYLINTHWHFDHTDGNEWLHAFGAKIIAHENTRKHLAIATRVDGWNFTFPAAPAGAIPTEVFGEKHILHLNDTGLLLNRYAPAHTDCDISVNFAEADVIHVGDTWWNGFYPFIDYSTCGSIDGMIRATEKNLALVTDKTIIIPGHGPVARKPDLVEYHDMLVGIRTNVAALKEQGRSLDETIAAKPTAAYDAKWGQFLMTPAIFTGLVYAGV